MRELLRAGPLLSLLGFATLNMLALDAHDTYFSVYLARLGGGPATHGFGWALPAVLEAPCFLGSAAMERRLGGGKTLLLAFACEVAALTGIALAPGAWWAVAAMTLQGPAFALFHGAAVPMIDPLAPAGWRASSQTLLWASCFGLGGVAANLAGGLLVQAMGLVGLYRALALFSGGAAALFWVGARRAVAAAAPTERSWRSAKRLSLRAGAASGRQSRPRPPPGESRSVYSASYRSLVDPAARGAPCSRDRQA